MAKYTMLLAEFLEGGGQLPASFSKIEGFEDLFILHFCNAEIGFETPHLFELKLEEKARLHIDEYKNRIDLLVTNWTKAKNPTKVFYELSNTKLNIGEQNSTTTELPFNASVAEPSIVNSNDAYENTELKGHTRKETGMTVDETIKIIQFLNSDINNVLYDLLDKFSNCFMKVY